MKRFDWEWARLAVAGTAVAGLLAVSVSSAGCGAAPEKAGKPTAGQPGASEPGGRSGDASAPKSSARSVKPTGRVGGNKGDTAFDFHLADARGNPVKLSDFKGKVVVLDFWATWCPPCKREIPGFIALQREYKNKGVEVVGVSLDDDWSPVEDYMSSSGINYTVVLGDDAVSQWYGNITSIPTTFVIDQDGIIQERHVGYQQPDVFKRAVESLL